MTRVVGDKDNSKTSRGWTTIGTMTRIGSAASEAPFGLVAPDALVKTNEGAGPRWVDVIETNPRHRRDRGLSAL